MSSRLVCFAFVAALASVARTTNEQRRPDGFTEFGYRRVKVIPIKLDWHKAMGVCMQLGGRLAIVNSEHENSRLHGVAQEYNKLCDHGTYWLNGRKAIDGTFRWHSDEIPVAPLRYDNYMKGEPNNLGGSEDCLQSFGGTVFEWNDEHCSKQFCFICEKNA